MTLCVVTKGHCLCQPDEGVFCPDYKPDAYVQSLMNAITELKHDLDRSMANHNADLNAQGGPSRPVAPNVDGRDFYELCQQYRHSKEIESHPSLPNTPRAFNNLREYIKAGRLPWPSYEDERNATSQISEEPS